MTYDDYQLRKDIDTVMQIADTLQRILSENNVSSLSELLSQYYDKSEIDFDTAKLNTSLDRVSTSLQTVYDDLNVLNEDLYDAEGHLKVTEEDMNQAKASITALNTSLTQLGNDLNNAEADLEDIESDLATAKSNLSQAIADLTNLSTELDTAKGRITTAEGKITTAENSISAHQTSITNLNTDLDSAKDRITATENSLTTANNSISAHETSISNLNTDLDSAETRLTTTEQNIQSLRTSLTELDGSLTVLSDMLIDFQGTMAEFDAELIERGIDKTDLNTDIYKLVRQICVVKQDITDTDTKIDDTVTDINNLDTTVVPNLKNKIQEAKASGDTAQQDLATAKTDINNLNSSTFPNLKNKIDEAKASGDTAQTALQQTKDDLEDLNTTVFPNLVGAIDDAQTSGDTAQQNLSQAITDINNVTAQGGTFAQLHGSIATAKSAGDTAQQNLDDSIDDIENLTGQVFPNLVNHINTTVSDIGQAQSDITNAQNDIGNVRDSSNGRANGDLQTQISQIINFFSDMIPVIGTLPYSKYIAWGRTSRGNYGVFNPDYSYDIIYVEDIDKYFEKQYLETDPDLLGYYGEWVELQSINQLFLNTHLYNMVDYYFAEDTHNHDSDYADISNEEVSKIIKTSSDYSSLSSGTIAFVKYGKQVICDCNFTFASVNASANNGKFVGSIPAGFTPSNILYDTHQPTIAVIDNSTSNTSAKHRLYTYTSNDVWQLGLASLITSGSANIRCQLTWITD